MPPSYHFALTRTATVSSLNTDDTFFFEGNLHPERYGGYTDTEEEEDEESYYPASRSGTRTPTTHSRSTRSPSVVPPRPVPFREATPSTWSVVSMSDAGYATDISSSTVTSGLAKSASASARSNQRAPTRESTPSLWSNVDPSDVGYATHRSSSTIAPRNKATSTSTSTRTPSRFSTPVHEHHQSLTSPMSQIRRSASVLTIDDDAQSVTSVDEPVSWDRVYADKQHRLAMDSYYSTQQSVLQPSDSRAGFNPEHGAYDHHRTLRAPTVLSLKEDDQTDCASYGPDLKLDIQNLYHANQSPALQAACLSKSPPSVRSGGGNFPARFGSVPSESSVESSNATITNPHPLAFCTHQDLENMRKGDSPSTSSGGRNSTTAIYDRSSRSPGSGRTSNLPSRTPRRTQRAQSSRDSDQWDAKSIASQVKPDSDNRVKCPWCSKTYPSMLRTRLAEHLTSKHGSAFKEGAF
ncbi:hypothetical protein CPC08DRAFT_726917 [Agrocybe pediades]|nr:hypothetical protein CPC08DRAFT_726917 [Agrocybe pediades]